MAKIALINATPCETRLALICDGRLDEVFIERQQNRSLVGDIYLGTVVRVLPSVGAVFIDIGRERSAFLSFTDLPTPSRPSAQDSIDTPTVGVLSMAGEQEFSQSLQSKHPKSKLPPNTPKTGDRLVVQVTKDEYGTKGVRVTTHIALPSRYLVYLPTSPQSFGVSTRIPNKKVRTALKELLATSAKQAGLTGGVIARSVCELAFANASTLPAQLDVDMTYAGKLWQAIEGRRVQASLSKAKFALLHQELALCERALRDIIDDDTDEIWVDERMVYEQLRAMSEQVMPSITPRIFYHQDGTPLFDKMDAEKQLNQALSPHFPLPSGGYLVIEHTEAMTTIDVNTGAFVGQGKRSDVAYETNQEAVPAIAHQLRLRNIAGIIILDFIDMDSPHQRQAVLQALSEALKTDPATTKISQISELGLIEMTRKRTRTTLHDELCSTCPTCAGTGYLKSVESVAFGIIRELLTRLVAINIIKKPIITVKVSPILADYFNAHQELLNLQNLTNITIHLEINTSYHQEQYAIIIDNQG